MTSIAHYVPALFAAILTVVSVYVAWRGQRAERAGLFLIVTGSILSGVLAQHGSLWRSGEIGIFLVDLAVLAGFTAVMAFSDRFWPMWVTAFQLVAVVTHLARFSSPNTVPMAYAIAEQFWVYPMLALITLATIRLGRDPATS